ncbi:MAG: CCAAT-binding factor complex subunit [Lasallia pustulata]|uniref:CCAAT-binding factor complex subunit n=1 Tax=Lasallia pustulata TaxID=136370 RepID=A0A5M8Q2G0_9LECA|nr:MAG: CCAAT-binding factor complex subunit [Lasallia pustulata]
MSASPPTKETDVEQGAPSPDNSEPMDTRDPDTQAREAYEFEVKEQDRWLPIANVARIMKTALPENAKIAKEAKECMQECVSEFISFITSEASEKCQQEKRKTVNGEDILYAMTSLGFENYAEALKIYLSKYRETQSARGENQNRPGSGYGAGGQPGGGGNAGSGPNASSSAAAYRGQAEGPNNILSPHGLESTEQESSPYGNVYPPVVGSSHNGAGGEPY